MSLACSCSCIQFSFGLDTLKSPGTELTGSPACLPDDLGFLQGSPASGCKPSFTTPWACRCPQSVLTPHWVLHKSSSLPFSPLILNSTGNVLGGVGVGGVVRASYQSESFRSISWGKASFYWVEKNEDFPLVLQGIWGSLHVRHHSAFFSL